MTFLIGNGCAAFALVAGLYEARLSGVRARDAAQPCGCGAALTVGLAVRDGGVIAVWALAVLLGTGGGAACSRLKDDCNNAGGAAR